MPGPSDLAMAIISEVMAVDAIADLKRKHLVMVEVSAFWRPKEPWLPVPRSAEKESPKLSQAEEGLPGRCCEGGRAVQPSPAARLRRARTRIAAHCGAEGA